MSATDIVVRYTYAGDLNLDGSIDGADYGMIDNYVQFPGTTVTPTATSTTTA